MSEPRKLQIGMVGTDGSTKYRVQFLVGDDVAQLGVMEVLGGHRLAVYKCGSIGLDGRERGAGWYIDGAPSGTFISFADSRLCVACGGALQSEDLRITVTSPHGRSFTQLCEACRTPVVLTALDQRYATPGTEPCEGCGRTLTRDEELDSTITTRRQQARYICWDCKTEY